MTAFEPVYFSDLPNPGVATAADVSPSVAMLCLSLPHLHAEEDVVLCAHQSLIVGDGDNVDLSRLRSHLAPALWAAFDDAGFSVHRCKEEWQLVPHSRDLVCAVNDVRLDTGSSCVLAAGDRIELGMLRLLVHDRQNERSDLEDATMVAVDAASATEDCAMRCAIAALDDELTNPFRDMPSFSRELHVTRAMHPQQGILGTEQDVIVQLAEQYAQVIGNPNSMHMHHTTAIVGQRPQDSGASLEALAHSYPAHYSLEDTLSGPLTIDQILADLGPLDSNWDRRAPAEDVLMLFAGDVPARTKAQLPALTRRDHHNLSPDSHVTMASDAIHRKQE